MLSHLFEWILSAVLLGWCFGCKSNCGPPPNPPVDCTVASDDFNRSDGTDIGSVFTESAGDSTLDAGRLKFTTTNAKATCNTNSPSATRAIVAKARASTANNLARVWCGDWVIEVRFSTTAGRVQLINPSGTAVSTSATNLNLPLNSDLIIEVCYDGNIIEANVDGVDKSYVQKSAVVITDLTNGLGTGGTVSGSVSFDDFELLLLDGEDCVCPITRGGGDQGCTYCTGATGPYYWMVEIAGVTNDLCMHCDAWNNIYILAPSSNVNCFAVTDNTACCCWRSPNGGDACSENISPNFSGEFAIATLQVCAAYDGFPAGIRVRMYHARTGGFYVYQYTHTTPIDCLSISGLSLSFQSGTQALCDWSGVTCTIWALP